MVGNEILFLQFFFLFSCRIEKAIFGILHVKTGNHFVPLQLPSDFESFSEQTKLRNEKNYYFLYEPTKKGKRFHIWKCHMTLTKKGKNLLVWKIHKRMTKKEAYKCNSFQLQNHSFTFIVKLSSLILATKVLSHWSMAINTTVSLDELIFAEFVDFGKCQDRCGQFSGCKKDSNYLDVTLEKFKRDDNRDFRLVQKLTMGEANFNKFMRLRN